MSGWFRRSAQSPGEMLADRTGQRSGGRRVSTDRAMRQSVVWACLRLRADLTSLMPIDVYRKSSAAGGMNVPVPTPPVLHAPSVVGTGEAMPIGEWLYSSQVALDGHGNNWGVVAARDSLGKPARIDLVAPEDVSARVKGSSFTEVRFAGEKINLADVWHERQYTLPGLPVGLSPIAYAAYTLTAGMNAQQFSIDWFENGAVPGAILKNSEKVLTASDVQKTKARFKASMQNGDVFVTGKDWTYSAVQAKAAESAFMDQMKYTDTELCRFLGVPGDMVDVATVSGSITYANVTQRNLQLLVMNMGGALKRREDALTNVVASPRFVKLNRAAIYAMDEKTRAEIFKLRIDSRTLTPDEARSIDDNQPLTDEDYAQFDRLFGARTPNQPQTSSGGSN